MRDSSRAFRGVVFAVVVLTLGVAPAQEKKIQIEFFIEAVKASVGRPISNFHERADELGGAVVTRSANGDDDLQFRQIKKLLERGIDVLVFLPHDTSKAGALWKPRMR